jgi:hypothetical protein
MGIILKEIFYFKNEGYRKGILHLISIQILLCLLLMMILELLGTQWIQRMQISGKRAMNEEMASWNKNEAWDIVELPTGRKPIGRKWLFKKKLNVEGKVEKYKARLVAKGYSRVEGIDFGYTFSPIAKLASIRFILSIVVAFDFEIEKMDVKTTFQHGDLEEEIYMNKPEGYVVKGKKDLVWKLKKYLYGLKQSPRMWYQKYDTSMLGLGFTRRKEDRCVYFKLIGDHLTYLVLYVDDMLLIGNNKEIIQDIKTQLSSKFDTKDLGASNFILGMEIKRDRKGGNSG